MKIKGFLKVLIVFFIMLCLCTTIVHAEDYSNPAQFDSYTSETTKNIAGTSVDFEGVDNFLWKALGSVLSVLRVVAFCIALILLIVIGIKYMASSPIVRAEFKKDMPTYFIGVIILFGASGILQLLTYFIKDTL